MLRMQDGAIVFNLPSKPTQKHPHHRVTVPLFILTLPSKKNPN